MKAWRCDLTGLSQLYNLYFVACNDTIRVYEPEFPDQTFAFEPTLILHPPVSSPNLHYGVDNVDPHSITRVVVEYLGNDEILLATCDDGDVVGYRVEEIQRAISTPQSSDEDDDPDYQPEVRLFLHRNVGASAWGLAVHREARIIAISANTHEITVLAYALVSRGEESVQSGFSEMLPADEDNAADFPSPRKRDHIITLRANHNVPAVSFNNTDEDLEGRWLFSSCINGEVRLWDLHKTDDPARIFEMGFCASVMSSERAPRTSLGRCNCWNAGVYPHSAWDAMFLDAQSAHEISPLDEQTEPMHDASFFEDAGEQKLRFRAKMRHGMSGEESTEDNDYNMSDSNSEMVLSEHDSESVDVDPEVEDTSDVVNDYTYLDHSSGSSENEEIDNDSADEEDEESNHEHGTEVYTGPPIPSMQTSAHETSPFQQVWEAAISQIVQTDLLPTSPDDEDDDDDEDEDDEDYYALADWFATPHALSHFRPHPNLPVPYCQIRPSSPTDSEHNVRNALIHSHPSALHRSANSNTVPLPPPTNPPHNSRHNLPPPTPLHHTLRRHSRPRTVPPAIPQSPERNSRLVRPIVFHKTRA
jgi:hypothetical protein